VLNIHSSGRSISQGLRRCALILGCVAGLTIAGCGDEAPQSGERKAVRGDSAGTHRAEWLEVSSPISPAQWLASRGQATVLPVSDPEVQRVATLLVEAHRRYRESERMIANRSVQVSEMLSRIGLDEGAIRILDDLTGIGGEVGQIEGFGAISQYYFNLRAASVPRDEAISTLKARYGSKS
jgi:hypothetical protein